MYGSTKRITVTMDAGDSTTTGVNLSSFGRTWLEVPTAAVGYDSTLVTLALECNTGTSDATAWRPLYSQAGSAIALSGSAGNITWSLGEDVSFDTVRLNSDATCSAAVSYEFFGSR